MIIKNYDKLGTSQLRKDALDIVNAGMEAVLTKNAIERFVSLQGNTLQIGKQKFNLADYDNIYVIGGGKAAADMAEAIEEILGDRITEGIVTDVVKRKLKHIEVVKGTHPLPSKTNMNACSKMVKIASDAGEKDLILTLMSGGGSAILAYPRTSLDNLIKMNKALLTCGADIYEMNAVRKHLSRIKGGQLSKISYPATLVTIIFSDVLGNDLSVIASGPTVKDKSKMKDVKKLIEKYNLPKLPEKDYEETPKERKWFKNTHNILLLDNSVAVDAMKKKSEELGYKTKNLGLELSGEAREFGAELAGRIKPGRAYVGAGETTVTVTGKGKGGRNQEVALGAIGNFERNGCVISIGTDGIDNTPAAGAISDNESLKRAFDKGLKKEEFLKKNDAYHFFKKLDDLIITGPTGTNVADIFLALGEKEF